MAKWYSSVIGRIDYNHSERLKSVYYVTTSKNVIKKYTSSSRRFTYNSKNINIPIYGNELKTKNANIYSTQNSVREVKIKCYPNLSEISFAETMASIEMAIRPYGSTFGTDQ